jgi:hypothetical protein
MQCLVKLFSVYFFLLHPINLEGQKKIALKQVNCGKL